MAEWCDEAISMLQSKVSDPYAAVVGAYLLLRLKRFAKMHDWVRNLANWFPHLPDGCVVWASQLMQQPSADADEIRHYLLEAVNRGLPVYTEGLRLLTDGLRLMDDEGTPAREKIRAATGVVVWDSPVTVCVQTPAAYTRDLDTPGIVYDIAFENRRVIPVSLLQLGRDDILGHAVELGRERVTTPLGPGLGKPLVGHPAQ